MIATGEHLTPPTTRGRISVAKLERYWYIACRGREVGRKPVARKILGTPMVLFRDRAGQVGALLDRCPHRNVPLSLGRVVDGKLECSYHGWRFEGGGDCTHVPALCGNPESRGRRAPAFATVEQDGYVWVYAQVDEKPDTQPFRFPHLDESGYVSVRRDVETQATLHATIENALDVPHTKYLHRGLFRSPGKGQQIEVIVRRGQERVEAEYLGEPRPGGLVARIFAPTGGTLDHWDRFMLPSIAQVEYRLGRENHLVVSAAHTPISDFHTKIYAIVSFRLRIPSWIVAPIVAPAATQIFNQDAKILRAQTDSIQRFGGEHYASTELDVLGSHIWRLLKQAERGDSPPAEAVTEQRVKMLV